jgi:hypothetical protein
MSSCTYTAQGFLLCPKQNNVASERAQPRYSTIGFDRDAEAGVFIEPFEQYQQGAPSITEDFVVSQTSSSSTIPPWVTDPNGQFSKQCKDCSIAKGSCDTNKNCSLVCTCSSCINKKMTNTLINNKISTKADKQTIPLFYCGGRKYSTKECDDTSTLTCEQEDPKSESKSAFIEFQQQQQQQRQNFQNSPYNMGQ